MTYNMIKAIYITICVLIAGTIQAQMYELFQEKTHVSQGDTLLYRLLEPTFQSPDDKYPVVLFLHGAGERGDDNKRQLYHVMPEFTKYAARKNHPCYVIAPQCPREDYWTSGERMPAGDIAWNDEVDPLQRMALEIVDQVLTNESADPDRVYVVGLSMGGAGTWDILYHYPDRFAAAIPICGWTDPEKARRIKDIPIWIFHGMDDNTVAFEESRTMYEALKQEGGDAILTALEGVRHNAWDYVFSDNTLVMDWLFSQSK
jgi:predicted peptidase